MFAKIEWMGTLVVGSITYLVLFPTFFEACYVCNQPGPKTFYVGLDTIIQ